MKRLLVALAGIALLAVVAWILWEPAGRAPEVGAHPAAAGAPTERSDVARSGAALLEAPERAADADLEREEVVARAVEPAVAPAAEDALAVALRGRFLLPDGGPAAGVELELKGWGAGQERRV
jgi:hypothetical protein